jgi:anaerobic magnesium-protoporphyrin IX monomethyl ester cyclase
MRILLLTPVASRRELWGQYEKGGGAYFPLGLLSIAGQALEAGHEVRLIDASTLGWEEAELENHLKQNMYDLIGLGNCYTALAHTVFRTARLCRKHLPKALQVVGGIHPTLFPSETLLACPDIDLAVFGEGEATFSQILDEVSSGQCAWSEVKGLAWRSAEGVTVNPPRPVIDDLGSLPPLPYHLLDVDSYLPPPSNYKKLPTYGFLVQRGCPYRCAYCDARIHGRRVRHDNLDKIIKQMRFLKETHGMKGIIFHDSCLTINRKFSAELFQRMIAEKLDLSWCCYTRVDKVDPELLNLMKRAGCWCVSYGLESGNEESLKLIHKGVTVEQNRQGVAMAKAAGLEVVGSFILCLPGEDEAMTRKTIQFAKSLKLNTAVFFLPVPFFGTELYEVCRDEGALPKNIEWEDFKVWMDPTQPIYVNPRIGKEKMVKLYNEAVTSFYLSPSTIFRAIGQVRSLTDLRKYFTGALSLLESFTRRVKK